MAIEVPGSLRSVFDRIAFMNEVALETAITVQEGIRGNQFRVVILSGEELKSTEKTQAGTDGSDKGDVTRYYWVRIKPSWMVENNDPFAAKDDNLTEQQVRMVINSYPQAYVETTEDRKPKFGEEWLAEYVSKKGGPYRLVKNLKPGSGSGSRGDYGKAGRKAKAEYIRSQINGMPVTSVAKWEDQIKIMYTFIEYLTAKVSVSGLPALKVTSRVRTLEQQIKIILNMYHNTGPAEVIHLYGKGGRGQKMVNAIEAGDVAELKVLASGSSGHAVGKAIDINSNRYTTAQIRSLLQIIWAAGGKPMLEPTKSNCWTNRRNHKTVLRTVENARGGSPGEPCYNEHIHIQIPLNWKQPA